MGLCVFAGVSAFFIQPKPPTTTEVLAHAADSPLGLHESIAGTAFEVARSRKSSPALRFLLPPLRKASGGRRHCFWRVRISVRTLGHRSMALHEPQEAAEVG